MWVECSPFIYHYSTYKYTLLFPCLNILCIDNVLSWHEIVIDVHVLMIYVNKAKCSKLKPEFQYSID